MIAFTFHVSPYGHSASVLLQLHVVSDFVILLICDRLSAIFKFSFPMPPLGRTSAFLKDRKALMQPRVTNGAVARAHLHPPLGPEPHFCLTPAFLTKESHVAFRWFWNRSSRQVFELIYVYCWQCVCLFNDLCFMLVLLNSVDLYKISASACLQWIVWGTWQRYMRDVIVMWADDCHEACR